MAVYSMSLVLLEYEGRHAGLHTGSQLRSLRQYKVRFRRAFHNDVTDRVAALGIRRRPRRGSRGGCRRTRPCPSFTPAGNSATSQAKPDGVPPSRDNLLSQQPIANDDQLFTSPKSIDHCKRWKLPSRFLANLPINLTIWKLSCDSTIQTSSV